MPSSKYRALLLLYEMVRVDAMFMLTALFLEVPTDPRALLILTWLWSRDGGLSVE